MYDSLIARITAFGLAGIVTLSCLAGINQIARHQHASALLAQDRSAPAMMVAASAARSEQL